MEPIALCVNGCGFYGSPENNNLCSKCYKDHCLKETESENTTLPPDGVVVDPEKVSSGGRRRRCESCCKKVGLLGFKCRCGGMFCGVHRYAQMHSCKFDYKTFDCQILEKANPLCVAPKLKDMI